MKCTKDYRLSYTERAKEHVSKMSLEEKVYLMSGKVQVEEMRKDTLDGKHYNWYPYPAGGNERLNIPEMKFCDGPRGVVCGNSTCFPVSMARGATFDIDLEERIGEAIGKEIRAHGGNFFGGVCINLPYNPGWGRSQEVYGEDSFHLGQFGSALVRGVQKHNVIACIKHYAFNSMENARFKIDVNADKRTEREVYLAHFKDCINEGAAAVMSAYNLYKGEYCGHSDYLLNQVLKDEWDFDGFVISDFIWGVKDTVKAANGGMDIEMCHTKYFGDNLVEAVKRGDISEEKIDEAAIRIVRTLLAFTEAEDEQEYPEELISSKEHINLALEAAEKSMTLIKNENETLPFNKESTKKIAVIGRLADEKNTGDQGSSNVYPEYVISPLEGIEKHLDTGKVIYNDGKDINKAVELAESSDAVVLVVGYNHDDEGEFVAADEEHGYTESIGGDRRKSLGLKDKEIELIKKVGPINKNNVVVLVGGNMIMINEWKDYVSSILMSYYSGMEGGTALARTLFGDNTPGGKLPFVIAKDEKDLPQVDWDADEITYEYYHGYAKLEKEGIEVDVPYGFGLSYTTFDVKNPKFKLEEERIIAECEVTNTGDIKGDEVIQLYVGFENSKVDRPIKSLRGFKRVTLEPKETTQVTITCPLEKLKWYNPEKDCWELEHMEYQMYIGTSSSNKDLLKGSLSI